MSNTASGAAKEGSPSSASPFANSRSRRGSISGQSTFSSASTQKTRASTTAATLQSYALDTLLNRTLSSIIKAPPRLPVAKNKEPLSLPTTTRNFRGFVQKSGPMFYFQDAVEATLMWDDWSWTFMWMIIWAVIATNPYLLYCVPSSIMALILIRTHLARFPPGTAVPTTPGQAAQAAKQPDGLPTTPTPAQVLNRSIKHPTSTGEGAVLPPLVPNPPHEGTIKYYENLRDIQNMMRLIIDGYDGLAPTVKYLNWSSYPRSMALLQLSLLATISLFFLGPYIPIRPILLVAGEGMFLMNHPWVKPALDGITASLSEERAKDPRSSLTARELRKVEMLSREMTAKLQEWLAEDHLDDAVWERGWKNVEMFENERFIDPARAGRSAVDGGWSAHNLTFGERKPWTKGSDGFSAEEVEVKGFDLDINRQVQVTLEPGWEWVEGDEWRIDWVGKWSDVGVDAEGFVYTDSDWQRPSPYAFGHRGNPPYPPPANSVRGVDEDEILDEEELPLDAIRSKNLAETRRRRWLRRAVRIRKPE